MTETLRVTSHPAEYSADFEVARQLHKKHGKSYYFATQLFPAPTRLATYALYGFFRVPDEIVDNSTISDASEVAAVRKQLCDWRDEWQKAYSDGDHSEPILRVTSYIFHRYNIPFSYSEHFLEAMMTDLDKATYADYTELEKYMYGSAAVVGLMMTYVVGFSEFRALEYAAKLGYAMQLTNFLRDIDEDYTLRRRVYFPQDELAAYNLSTQDIAERRFDERFKHFVQFQSERCHQFYFEAENGIALLEPSGRLPVRVASSLYRAILDKIDAQGCNVFAGRARTSLPEKIFLTAQAVRRNHALNHA